MPELESYTFDSDDYAYATECLSMVGRDPE